MDRDLVRDGIPQYGTGRDTAAEPSPTGQDAEVATMLEVALPSHGGRAAAHRTCRRPREKTRGGGMCKDGRGIFFWIF